MRDSLHEPVADDKHTIDKVLAARSGEPLASNVLNFDTALAGRRR